MAADAYVVALGALAVSALLTMALLSFAVSAGMLDIPNARSSHGAPTPRGGGIGIVVATTASLAVLMLRGALSPEQTIALGGGGLIVAAVGYIDDRRSVPSGLRLAVHFAAASWALAWLGGMPPLSVAGQIVNFGWPGNLLAATGIVWALNLFNFMDGIDGIAASEAVFVAAGATFLGLIGPNSGAVPPLAIAFAAACCGFLLWNWPPAKIFMGDVGSGYLGFMVAALAIVATRENPDALWSWLILGGVFLVDATLTLLRRMFSGERIYQAHRSHAYQWLARRWGSHRRVTLVVTIVNLLWLLPCAWLATRFGNFGPAIMIGALAPLAALALAAGAGRTETQGTSVP